MIFLGSFSSDSLFIVRLEHVFQAGFGKRPVINK